MIEREDILDAYHRRYATKNIIQIRRSKKKIGKLFWKQLVYLLVLTDMSRGNF